MEDCPKPERERLVGVQYLRALAASQVVLHHCSALAGHHIPLGGFGVPLFFVISGFIMVVITDEGTRPGAFMRSRVIRVVPLYWLATSAAAVMALVLSSLSLPHLAASYAFIPFPMPGADEHFFPVLGVGWTLNYEMLFYALFAASLFLPGRLRLPALSLVMLGLAVTGVVSQPDSTILAFWTRPIVLMFLAGVWMGVWWKGSRRWLLWPLLACGAALALRYHLEAEQLRSTLWRGSWSVLALLAVLMLERAGAFRKPFRPLHLLGDASYSLYLWHLPLLVVLAPVLRAVGVSGVWDFLAITMAASIAAGLVSYWLIERPLLRLFHLQRFRRGVRIPAGP